jgi:DNA-directed RNA polymerase specialized sigma24 family protein
VSEVGDAEDVVQEAYLRAHRVLADDGDTTAQGLPNGSDDR